MLDFFVENWYQTLIAVLIFIAWADFSYKLDKIEKKYKNSIRQEYKMNIKPVIAQKSPYPIEVEEGKSYYWCQCGQSKKQTLL